MDYSRKKNLSQARVCKCSHSSKREGCSERLSGSHPQWEERGVLGQERRVTKGSGSTALNKIICGMDNGESCWHYSKKLK